MHGKLNVPSIVPRSEGYDRDKNSPNSCTEEVEGKDITKSELE